MSWVFPEIVPQNISGFCLWQVAFLLPVTDGSVTDERIGAVVLPLCDP